MEESTIDSRRCQALKKDGTPCSAWADRSTGFCGMHGPNAAELHAKGGRSRSKHHQLEMRLNPDLKSVLSLLLEGIKQVHHGELAPAKAQAMASLAGALVKVTEFAELEARLVSLEKKVKADIRLNMNGGS